MLQEDALELMECGYNILLTGGAGTGKSHTLKKYITHLEKLTSSEKVAITASTGLAASLIGGKTIHSWLGIGVKQEMTDQQIFEMLQKNDHKALTIKKCKVLIMDEISMLHRKQFELANRVVQIAKSSSLPFGGIQVIIVGDFCQLPPVVKERQVEPDRERFCFMSKSWTDLDLKHCYLEKSFRSESNQLNDLLNAIRTQSVKQPHLDLLKNRIIKTDKDVLELHTHNTNVDYINFQKLASLDSESKTFSMVKEGNFKLIENLMKNCLAVEELELKVGAKVLFIRNDPIGIFVNGTQGVIKEFKEDPELGLLPVVETKDGETIIVEKARWEAENHQGVVVAYIEQFPLKLAWAITIHKSQGMSLQEAKIDLNKVFEHGQGYVALSRLTNITGVFLIGFNQYSLHMNKLAIKADQRFRELSEENLTEHKKLGPEKTKELIDKFNNRLK